MYATRVIGDMRVGKKHDPIGLWFKPDKKLIGIDINYLTFLIWAYLRLIFAVFPKNHPKKEINLRLRNRSKDFDKALGSIVKTMPNKYEQVGTDFEKVIKIVRVAEKKGNWRILV